MENLSKQQIVLLSILVSFVTSIATGIMTVSLLQEAPPVVTQTVNRVVERTVEKVIPQVVESKPGKTVVERETVVVKEDELVPSAVEKNGAAIVRVYTRGTEAGAQEKFSSIGLLVGKGTSVITPRIEPSPYVTVTGAFSDGVRRPLSFATSSGAVSIWSFDRKADDPEFLAVTLGRVSSLRLGQTVITIGGGDQNEVSIGIITSFDASSTTVRRIQTNMGVILPGTPLISLGGQVVGILLPDKEGVLGSGIFTPLDDIRTELALP